MQTVVAHGRLLKSLGKTSGTLYGTERGKGPVPSRRLLENQAQKNVPVHLTAVCEEARHKHFAQAWEYKMRQNMLNSSESWFGNSKKKKNHHFTACVARAVGGSAFVFPLSQQGDHCRVAAAPSDRMGALRTKRARSDGSGGTCGDQVAQPEGRLWGWVTG